MSRQGDWVDQYGHLAVDNSRILTLKDKDRSRTNLHFGNQRRCSPSRFHKVQKCVRSHKNQKGVNSFSIVEKTFPLPSFLPSDLLLWLFWGRAGFQDIDIDIAIFLQYSCTINFCLVNGVGLVIIMNGNPLGSPSPQIH